MNRKSTKRDLKAPRKGSSGGQERTPEEQMLRQGISHSTPEEWREQRGRQEEQGKADRAEATWPHRLERSTQGTQLHPEQIRGSVATTMPPAANGTLTIAAKRG